MSVYIRRRIPGASYFFTIRLADRRSDLLIRRIGDLRQTMRRTLTRYPFRIDAITILPDVIHTIWTLPPEDSNYSGRIAMLKSGFSRMQPLPPDRTLTQIKRGEKGIWQRRFWEHQIRDAPDFHRHRDLIYLSPVHTGLCPRPQDWAHTSLHRDLRQGAVAPPPIGHGKTAHRGADKLHLTQPPSADQIRHKNARLVL